MSNEIFPSAVRGLTWNSPKMPEESTTVQIAVSGAEVRLVNWKNPIWHWDLTYDYIKNDDGDIAVGLTATDLKTLMGFFLTRQGRYDSFLYSDPVDNHVGVDDQELVVINVGGTYYTPIQRQMGDFYEDISDFDGPLSLYDNGVLMANPADYTLLGPGVALNGYAFYGYVAQWVAPPTGPVTADFGFFFRARFDSDKAEFEEFVKGLWTLGGSEAQAGSSLKIRSIRVPMQ